MFFLLFLFSPCSETIFGYQNLEVQVGSPPHMPQSAAVPHQSPCILQGLYFVCKEVPSNVLVLANVLFIYLFILHWWNMYPSLVLIVQTDHSEVCTCIENSKGQFFPGIVSSKLGMQVIGLVIGSQLS